MHSTCNTRIIFLVPPKILSCTDLEEIQQKIEDIDKKLRGTRTCNIFGIYFRDNLSDEKLEYCRQLGKEEEHLHYEQYMIIRRFLEQCEKYSITSSKNII